MSSRLRLLSVFVLLALLAMAILPHARAQEEEESSSSSTGPDEVPPAEDHSSSSTGAHEPVVIEYWATLKDCDASHDCPPNNSNNLTYALRRADTDEDYTARNITIAPGNTLKLTLAQKEAETGDYAADPLVICKNSWDNAFCADALASDQVSGVADAEGEVAQYTFPDEGVFAYGSVAHPGMGGYIHVTHDADDNAAVRNGAFSAAAALAAVVALVAVVV